MFNTTGMTNNILREYRETNGISRAELADQLGISLSMVAHIENSIRGISPERAISWSKLLGIPKEKLCPRIFA